MRDNSGVLPQAQLVELSHLINMVRISHNSKSRHDTIHLNHKCQISGLIIRDGYIKFFV